MTYDPVAIEALRESLGITDMDAGEYIFRILESGKAVTLETVALEKSAHLRKSVTALDATTRILQEKYGNK